MAAMTMSEYGSYVNARGHRRCAYRRDQRELIATVEAAGVQVTRNLGESFVGIWNYDDNGDVPPKAVLKGPSTMLIAPRGAALNLRDQEIYVIMTSGCSVTGLP